MIDTVMLSIGAFFIIAGGVMMMVSVLGLLVWAAANIWIEASNKWRRILRAESLIYEYRKNRKEFLRWREREEGADNG